MRFLLIFFLISFSSSAQEREGSIIFNDGTSIKGLAEIKKDKIFFRTSRDSKKSEWDFEMAKGVKFTGYGFIEEYVYIKPDQYTDPIIVEVLETGVVSLYTTIDFSLKPVFSPTLDKNTHLGQVMPTWKWEESRIYYVLRDGESNATDISFSFRNRALKYFADCPELHSKIEKREFKKSDIREIVYYYNDYCNGW